MNTLEMLLELGYSRSDIAAFQRDFNRMGTDPVLVTGELDEETEEAVGFAYRSRHAFVALRDRKKG